MSLAELFPDSDYHFQMGLGRGSVAQFFGPSPDRERLLAQRRHWLRAAPETYAALLPEGIPLLEEAVELAYSLGNFATKETLPAGEGTAALDRCRALGEAWEPDFLLLKTGADGQIRLWGGSVCFPSSWSLSEKMGRPMHFIHGAVPGLNDELGRQIHSFLTRIKPATAWLRSNWGLSRSPELNQHPDRPIPRLDGTVTAQDVWLRVEHQALAALPRTAGILFGIRVAIHALAEVKADPTSRRRLRRALQTMTEPVARYKGLAQARETVIQLLDEGSSKL